MAVKKVIINGQTKVDLTDTTAIASDVAEGKKFYGADGAAVIGTNDSASLDQIRKESLELVLGMTQVVPETFMFPEIEHIKSGSGWVFNDYGKWSGFDVSNTKKIIWPSTVKTSTYGAMDAGYISNCPNLEHIVFRDIAQDLNMQVFSETNERMTPSDMPYYYWFGDLIGYFTGLKTVTILNKEYLLDRDRMTTEELFDLLSKGTEIPTYLFYMNSPLNKILPLEKIIIPSSIEYIHASAFGGGCCAFAFNEGLKEIGDGAFDNAGVVDTLILPSTLTYIGSWCFSNTCVIAIEIKNDHLVCSSDSFASDLLTMIVVPVGTKSNYQSKPNWSQYADIMVEKGEILQFTISNDDTVYQYEAGMTWGDWINSTYNTSNWHIDENYIYNGSQKLRYYCEKSWSTGDEYVEARSLVNGMGLTYNWEEN